MHYSAMNAKSADCWPLLRRFSLLKTLFFNWMNSKTIETVSCSASQPSISRSVGRAQAPSRLRRDPYLRPFHHTCQRTESNPEVFLNCAVLCTGQLSDVHARTVTGFKLDSLVPHLGPSSSNYHSRLLTWANVAISIISPVFQR